MAISQLQTTRSITGSSVPILAWVPFSAQHAVRYLCPETMGGVGDLYANLENEAARRGKTFDDMIGEVCLRQSLVVKLCFLISVFCRYLIGWMGPLSGFLALLQCMTMSSSLRMYVLFLSIMSRANVKESHPQTPLNALAPKVTKGILP